VRWAIPEQLRKVCSIVAAALVAFFSAFDSTFAHYFQSMVKSDGACAVPTLFVTFKEYAPAGKLFDVFGTINVILSIAHSVTLHFFCVPLTESSKYTVPFFVLKKLIRLFGVDFSGFQV
jgi:hypothetical protein